MDAQMNVAECDPHDWKETGIRRRHVEGYIFKYGTRPVNYVRCSACDQVGFHYDGSPLIFTWRD